MTPAVALGPQGLTLSQFRRRYPRLTRRILQCAGATADASAAISIWLRSEPWPQCAVCSQLVRITTRYRDPVAEPRCQQHQRKQLVSAEQLRQLNQHGYQLVHVPSPLYFSSDLQLRCAQHGEFTCTVRYLSQGRRCRRCYHQQRRGQSRTSVQHWIQRANQVHQGRYGYQQVQFQLLTDLVVIECPVHGDFQQQAGSHVRGHGCSQCRTDQNIQKQTLTSEEFVKRARQVHADLYDYSQVCYQGSRATVRIGCAEHGFFDQVAYYHLAGNGCAECAVQRTTYKSAPEYQLLQLLQDMTRSPVVHSWRGLGTELDIWLPEQRLAIEYDGLFWHSTADPAAEPAAAQRHVRKTQLCEQAGIQLLHIWENEWTNPVQREIWISLLKRRLDCLPVQLAESCELVRVNTDQAQTWLQQHHLAPVQMLQTDQALALSWQKQLLAMAVFRHTPAAAAPWQLLAWAESVHWCCSGALSRLVQQHQQQTAASVWHLLDQRWASAAAVSSAAFSFEQQLPACYYQVVRDQLLSSTTTAPAGARRIWDAGWQLWRKE